MGWIEPSERVLMQFGRINYHMLRIHFIFYFHIFIS